MRRSLLTALCLVLALAATPAAAALIEVDLFAGGDGLVTRDTVTGLDWLDLTETQGDSIADILGGSGGWVDDGWRLATATEVCGLYAGVGVGPPTCPTAASTVYVLGSGVLPGVTELHDLLGVTLVIGSDIRQLGWLDDEDAGDPLIGIAEVSYVGGDSRSVVRINATPYTETTASLNAGSYLVRSVPEPASGALLALGLTGLAVVRRGRGCSRAGER